MRGAQVDALDALALRAAAVDEVPPKVYWPLLARSDPGVLHLLGHDGGALLAAASSFCFGPGELEFTCLVEPDARGRGVPRALARPDSFGPRIGVPGAPSGPWSPTAHAGIFATPGRSPWRPSTPWSRGPRTCSPWRCPTDA